MTESTIRSDAKAELDEMISNMWGEYPPKPRRGEIDPDETLEKIREQAALFIDFLGDNGKLSSQQNPSSSAAGAINAAANCLDVVCTPGLLTDKVDVGKSTIAKYTRQIRDLLFKQFKATKAPDTAGPDSFDTDSDYLVPDANTHPLLTFHPDFDEVAIHKVLNGLL